MLPRIPPCVRRTLAAMRQSLGDTIGFGDAVDGQGLIRALVKEEQLNNQARSRIGCPAHDSDHRLASPSPRRADRSPNGSSASAPDYLWSISESIDNSLQNFSIYLQSFLHLLFGQALFAHCIKVKLALPVGDPAMYVGMVDRLRIQGLLLVSSDSTNGLENPVGGKAKKLLDAHVANHSTVAIVNVAQNADFVDRIVIAQACVRFVFAVDLFKIPFKFSLIPRFGIAARDDFFYQFVL